MKRLLAGVLLAAVAFTGCARAPRRVTPPPPAPHATAPAGPSAPLTHTVERGQTLYRIAKMYRVDVRELMRLNGVSDARSLEVGQRLKIPGDGVPRREAPYLPAQVTDRAGIERLVGPAHASSLWRTITVHHSATKKGSAERFHRDHLRRRMGGLFYHFVIGNGSYSGDGQVEVGFRWKRQIKANRPYDIQICLVGDFSQDRVSEAQFAALVTLIDVLQKQYAISDAQIRKHEDIKGKHTACPGKNFPFSRLLRELDQR